MNVILFEKQKGVFQTPFCKNIGPMKDQGLTKNNFVTTSSPPIADAAAL